jgi:hypothetical protein
MAKKLIKNYPIFLRATRLEYIKIKIKAKQTNRSISRFAIEKCLSDEIFQEKIEQENLKLLLFEVRKAGNNLNQIAHSLNLSRLTDTQPPSENEINKATNELKNTIELIKKRL